MDFLWSYLVRGVARPTSVQERNHNLLVQKFKTWTLKWTLDWTVDWTMDSTVEQYNCQH